MLRITAGFTQWLRSTAVHMGTAPDELLNRILGPNALIQEIETIEAIEKGLQPGQIFTIERLY